MLWEFASALAPGIIGGGFFFAIWILSREGIDAGKSITVITFTSFLDGIFIAVMAPLVYFTVGRSQLFSGMDTGMGLLGTRLLRHLLVGVLHHPRSTSSSWPTRSS